mmetsp:Transcript_36015/g.117670  ORF Transcript_36015/g.117670 Transcript_36015/m.117670 type:complete len:465 (+) Transcript_36015:90-1484(+)
MKRPPGAPSTAVRTSRASPVPRSATPELPLPSSLASLTDLSATHIRDFAGSLARRVGLVLGGPDADACWRILEDNPAAVESALEEAFEEALEAARDSGGGSEAVLPPHLRSRPVGTEWRSSLRARARALGALAARPHAESADPLRRWDAAPYPSRERLELDALDALIQVLADCEGVPARVQERAGFLAKHCCSICYVEAVRPATAEEIAAGVPTVEFVFRSPCFHDICVDCALRDAVEHGGDAMRLEHLDLKCPICREPVSWPWSRSEPHVADSLNRGLGPSLLQSSTYRLPDERLLELITPERVRETNPGGRLPLHAAVGATDSEAVIRRLVEMHPTAASWQTVAGELPLHVAAGCTSSPYIIRALVDAYPDGVRKANQAGEMALHKAAYNVSLPVVRAVLEAYPEALHVAQAAPAHQCAAVESGPTPGRIAELHNRNPDVAALLRGTSARVGWFPRFLSFAR